MTSPSSCHIRRHFKKLKKDARQPAASFFFSWSPARDLFLPIAARFDLFVASNPRRPLRCAVLHRCR